MANFNLSPNMSLVVPIPGVEVGPDWASELNASLTIIDAHTHAPGSGVQITPGGININSDLTMNEVNNLIEARSIRLFPNTSPLSLGTDLGVLYEAGVDLYYNDGSGNQIRLTQSGSVVGAPGTITGLPSGTASAAYLSSSGTFQLLQATSTAANLDIGTVILRYPGSYPTPAGNYIAIQAPSSLATGYAFTLPANTPVTGGAFLTSDTSGVISYTNIDSTLSLSAGTLRVNTAGVGTTQLANQSVTLSKLAPSNTSSSAASGTFVTGALTETIVTLLTVGIGTIGRPVMFYLIPQPLDLGGARIISNGTSHIVVRRDGVSIGGIEFQDTIPNVVLLDDAPPSGSHTYRVYAFNNTGSTVEIKGFRSVVTEI